MTDLDDTQLAPAWIGDADFERLVLGTSDRSRAVAVLFCHAGSPEAQAAVARFAIGSGPLLVLFLGGTFRSIFDFPQLAAPIIAHWIESQAQTA